MDALEYCQQLKIETTTLSVWVEQRWIIPLADGNAQLYHDADIARGRLILDLIDQMGVNENGVDVVMALIDQVHGLRGKLQALTDAVRDQDYDVQRRIISKL